MHGLFTFSAHPHKHLSARFGTTLLEKNLNFQGAYRKYSSFFQEGWSTTWPAPFREDPFSPKSDPPGKRNSPSPIFSDFLHSPSSPLPVLPSALGAFTSLEHNLPPSLKNLIFLGRLPKKVKFFFQEGCQQSWQHFVSLKGTPGLNSLPLWNGRAFFFLGDRHNDPTWTCKNAYPKMHTVSLKAH